MSSSFDFLSLVNVSRSFRQGSNIIPVLKSINLKLFSGESVALLGPSGSGKSTLLHICGLLDTPDSGEVCIKNIPVPKGEKNRTMLRRSYLGFVYQFHHLLPEFSAWENVIIAQRIHGLLNRENQAQNLLTRFGLAHRLQHFPSQLSGGEQQRVAIARSLVHSPSILLADEPTGNLDEKTSEIVFQEMMEYVKEKKIAALIATHNLRLAQKMDRIIYLDQGFLKEWRALEDSNL